MIKILLIFVVLFSSFQFTYCDNSYARITNSHTYLYRTASRNTDTKNIICVMENTYYVEILLIYDEDFYKVNYNGVSGYVLRQDVKRVKDVPTHPYPSGVEMVTINNNSYLRTSPNKSNNSLTIVPSNCSKLNYIGKIYGEQVDDFRQNLWYYVEYQGVYGYIYSEYIRSISSIYPNVEELSYVNDNDFDDIINPLSNSTCILIIVGMSVPILIIMYMIYKKPRRSKSKFKEKVVIKEYDEKL